MNQSVPSMHGICTWIIFDIVHIYYVYVHHIIMWMYVGLLNGVADMLVSYDESEVRRIVKSCRAVQEYLKVAEVVQSMEDLVTFTKNLTPGTASMTKAVEARSEELNNRYPLHKATDITQFKQLCKFIMSLQF